MKTLLMIRKHRENSAQKEMLQARQYLQKILEILEELQEESTLLGQQLQSRLKGKSSVFEYRNHFMYLEVLQQKIQERQDDILKAQNIVEAKRVAVTKAMQNKKIIEKIREKQYSSWQDKYQKLEAKMLDELATIRHIRTKEKFSNEP